MRHGEGNDLRHSRMIDQHALYLERRDLFAAAIDDLLQPAGDAQIIVLVEHALVAGVKPAMGEGAGIGFGVLFVAGGDVRSADDDLADLASLEQPSTRCHDGHFRAGGCADAARLALAWRQAVGRHLMRRLGHAVRFDHRAAEGRLEFRHDLYWE